MLQPPYTVQWCIDHCSVLMQGGDAGWLMGTCEAAITDLVRDVQDTVGFNKMPQWVF